MIGDVQFTSTLMGSSICRPTGLSNNPRPLLVSLAAWPLRPSTLNLSAHSKV